MLKQSLECIWIGSSAFFNVSSTWRKLNKNCFRTYLTSSFQQSLAQMYFGYLGVWTSDHFVLCLLRALFFIFWFSLTVGVLHAAGRKNKKTKIKKTLSTRGCVFTVRLNARAAPTRTHTYTQSIHGTWANGLTLWPIPNGTTHQSLCEASLDPKLGTFQFSSSHTKCILVYSLRFPVATIRVDSRGLNRCPHWNDDCGQRSNLGSTVYHTTVCDS